MTYFIDDEHDHDRRLHDSGPRIYACDMCGVDCVLVEDQARSNLIVAAVLGDGRLWCEECWHFDHPDNRPVEKKDAANTK